MTDDSKQAISLRIHPTLLADVERARVRIAQDRGLGAKEVSLTEVIEILVTHGLFRLGIAGDEGGMGYEDILDEEIASPRGSTSEAEIERLREVLKTKHGLDLGATKRTRKTK